MKLLAFDTETHLIQPGLLTPPLVCGSVATEAPGSERLLSKEETREAFKKALADPSITLGGANIVYDLGVMAADSPECVPLIFKALEEGRIVSTDILEALHDNARGLMFQEANGTPFARYSLAQLEARYLGLDRSAEKEDGWRYRYAELDGVPLEQWPDDAVQYPRRDARGTFDVLEKQLAEGRNNRECYTGEMRAAWFLQLACAYGMRTDPLMVPHIVRRIRAEHEESRRKFFLEGIVRIRPCVKKEGEWERADALDLNWLDDVEASLCARPLEPWMAARLADIATCRAALVQGRTIRFAEDKGHLSALVDAAYQGDAPLTSGGASGNQKTSTSRDTLLESGEPLLEEYGEAGPNEKLLSTYVNVLEQGTRVPINPSANTLVATQRTSYRKPNLQQLPRKGGVREAFVPRPGWLYCSVDYAALELSTLGQVCLNLFGHSAMADAINEGQDLHTRLAARIAGLAYEEAMALRAVKDPLILSLRQAAKPCLGAETQVLTPCGWKRIVDVTREDRVWDGVEWVRHEGLIDRGVKETWNFQRVDATPGHEVWTGDGWVEWRRVLTSPSLFKQALCSVNLPFLAGSSAFHPAAEAQGTIPESVVCAVESSHCQDRSSSQATPSDVGTVTNTALSLTEQSASRNSQCPPSIDSASWPDSRPQSDGATIQKPEVLPHTEGAEFLSVGSGETTARYSSNMCRPSMAGTAQRNSLTESTTTEGTNRATSDLSQPSKTSTTEGQSEKCNSASMPLKRRMPVYDLAYAGPRNRFTILTDAGPLIVHNCNFGLPGLMGPPKLVLTARKDGVRFCELAQESEDCGANPKVTRYHQRPIAPTCSICLRLAIKYRDLWKQEWPEMVEYHKCTIAQAEECGDGTPLKSFGSGMLRLETNANAVSNHFFQNLAAQGAKHAGWLLAKEAYTDKSSVLYGNWRNVVFVHDEIIAEVREEVAHECALRQAEVMIAGMREFVPDVKISAEPCLMRRWFKGADKAVTKDGRLKPWWPKDWTWGPDQTQMAEDNAA